MTRPEILLIGGGGHCHSVIDVIEQQGSYQIRGIVDVKARVGTQVLGHPVVGCDTDLATLRQQCSNAVITVGHIENNHLRVKLYSLVRQLGFDLPIIISPLAYVSPHARIQDGTVVLHQALVNAGAQVGLNGIINSKALIEHDVIVGNHCHISTAAVLNGGVFVDDNSFVGSNSVVIQGAKVGGFLKAGRLHK